MNTALLATLISTFALPSPWKPVSPPSQTKVKTFGTLVAQYVTDIGGAIQVRAETCRTKDECYEFGDVTTHASDYLDAYCKGRFGDAIKCVEADNDDEPSSKVPAWARVSSALADGHVLNVFVANRAKAEKKLYVFVYNGPAGSVSDFIVATDKLKSAK